MFFFGAKDEELSGLTSSRFPGRVVSGKKHPVFSLKPLPEGVGFQVCPCSSKRPFEEGVFRYIEKGCRLRHTAYIMDRDSYLIELARFNIPVSMAGRLLFKGEVPADCLRTAGAGR